MSNVLAEASVAVIFSCGVWTARKQDKNAARTVAEVNGIDERSGRYWKDLMKCDELEQLRRIERAARNLVYQYTLPWREGVRIMPAAMLMRLTQKDPPSFPEMFNTLRVDWDIALERFLRVYDAEVAIAPKKLGPLFNAADYPPSEQIRQKFHLSVSYDPLPTANDFRIQLTDTHMEQLKADLEARMSDAQSKAVNDLWERIGEQVRKMHETLSDPNKRFWDSMFDNTKELCAIVSRLNFTNDPELEAVRNSVEKELAVLDPDTLRADNVDPSGYRAQAAKKAAEILAKVKQFGGV